MLNIYRASAGSGKTFQLTKDYIFLLFDSIGKNPRPHRRILAVTFTNKATDEMKSRILKELHLLSKGEKSDYRNDLMSTFSLTEEEVNERARKILISILHDFSSFSISTIDKFSQQLVRSFAREIGISGGYNVELDVDMTLQQSIDNMYADLSEKGNEQLMGWMISYLQDQIEDGKTWRVDKEITTLGKEIFKENFQQKAQEIREKLNDKTFLRDYSVKLRKLISDFEKSVNSEVENIYNILAANDLTGYEFRNNRLISGLKKIYENKDFDLKYNKSIITYSQGIENCITNPQKNPHKDQITNAYSNGIGESLNRIVYLLTEGIIPHNSAKIILRHINTLGILTDLTYQINSLNAEKNIMLISDTNQLLNKIIDNSETPFVYERTGVNIDHFMIDEFQDTSKLQWENFKPLVGNSLAAGKTNMVVGDVKQSIYRWRNSDWKLLGEQVNKDFSSQQTNQKTLEKNWRSDRNIVDFNNSFFETASRLLQDLLNTNLGNSIENEPELKEFTNIITNAYSDVKQQISNKASDGFVQFRFINQENVTQEWEESILEKIPPLLEDLVDRGYKPKDIAFLVREKKYAPLLMNHLIQYKISPKARKGFSYDVVGNEGIKLSSSRTINFIIATLQLILNPKEDVFRTIMQYEYQVGKMRLTEGEAVSKSIGCKINDTSQSSIFSEEENSCIAEISRLPLYEAIEKLIKTFNLENWHNETVFLQAFQDVIFKFTNSYNADLNSFIRWWNENQDSQFIDTPENENAYRVMTIHKAKGLDFKVVIVPFCNWSLDVTNYSIAPLLWCEPTVPPFNELPLIPVKYYSKLKQTIFRNDFFEEMLHQFVDNLNLAYVAFTRARNEMHSFCLLPKPDKDGVLPLKTISDLLYKSILEITDFKLTANEDNDELLTIGAPTKAVYQEEISDSTSKNLNTYPITESSERLKIRHTAGEYWKTAPISESRVNYGTIMHEILQKTIRRGDEEKAVSEQIALGKITKSDLPEIQKELERFWSLPEVNEWFVSDAEVLNECSILLPNGDIYRPDRVLLKDNKATVIDYKFGVEEYNSHTRQLQHYTDFLKNMGYDEVVAKLYYVSLGKVITL